MGGAGQWEDADESGCGGSGGQPPKVWLDVDCGCDGGPPVESGGVEGTLPLAGPAGGGSFTSFRRVKYDFFFSVREEGVVKAELFITTGGL